MAQRKLPADEKLAELVRDYTDATIAEMFGVRRQSVSKARDALGLPSRVPRGAGNYREFIPWVVKVAHNKHYLLRMLRLYARSETGGHLSPKECRMLNVWRANMDNLAVQDHDYCGPVVVAYDPEDDEGFYLVPARPEDARYVRRPKAEAA